MCLIKFRRDQEEEIIIPNRPVKVEGPPPKRTNSQQSDHATSPAQHDPRKYARERTLSSGSQALVIEQSSLRVSMPAMQRNGLLTVSHGLSQDPMRKSGSLSHGRTPRQSNASFRTTRERIVVVDDTGRRREYYRRDDSGR